MSIDPNLAPRDDENDEDLARAWIAHQKAPRDTPESDSLFWTWNRLRFLTEYLPDKAWKVIKLIVSEDRSVEVINNLIDGPIDDLLRNFGIEMIDLVEAEINRLPELQPLLAYARELDGRRTHWVRSEFHGRARDGSLGQELAPHDDERDDDLARAWVAHYQADHNSNRSNALLWASDRMDYLVTYLPQRAWRLIRLIWSIDQSSKTMSMLSAGPIESLLSNHGPEVIPLVETEARRDPSFARLLGGVWRLGMTDEVWARLQAVWDRRGWDGIPEE